MCVSSEWLYTLNRPCITLFYIALLLNGSLIEHVNFMPDVLNDGFKIDQLALFTSLPTVVCYLTI